MNKEKRNLSTDEKRSIIKKKNANIKDLLLGNDGKALGVISDKQYVLFTQDLDIGIPAEDIVSLLYEERDADQEKFDENVFYEIDTSKENLKISIKYSNNLSNNQYTFLNDILNEINEYNNTSNNKVIIQISDIEETDVDKVKELLKNDVQNDKITHDIYIFGKRLSSEVNTQNFKDKINKNFKNINEIVDAINKIEKVFLNDEFYFQLIRKLMPNYSDIIYIKDRLISVLPLLDNNEDEKYYNIDIFDITKLLSILNNEYNRFMKNIDNIFSYTNMNMDQRVLILNMCLKNNNDLDSIYPDIKNFIYFYYYYASTLPKNLFSGITDYQTCFDTMLNYIKENLQSKLAKEELKKHALEKNMNDEKIFSNRGKFYKYTEEISNMQIKLNVIDSYKKYDINDIKYDYEVSSKKEKIKSNSIRINDTTEKIRLLSNQIEKYERRGFIYKFIKKNSNELAKIQLDDLKKSLKEMQNETKEINEQLDSMEKNHEERELERTKQIEEIIRKIEKAKQKFKSETTVDFDEFEEKSKKYNNFDKDLNKKYVSICSEIDDIKSNLQNIEDFINRRQNNNKIM